MNWRIKTSDKFLAEKLARTKKAREVLDNVR